MGVEQWADSVGDSTGNVGRKNWVTNIVMKIFLHP